MLVQSGEKKTTKRRSLVNPCSFENDPNPRTMRFYRQLMLLAIFMQVRDGFSMMMEMDLLVLLLVIDFMLGSDTNPTESFLFKWEGRSGERWSKQQSRIWTYGTSHAFHYENQEFRASLYFGSTKEKISRWSIQFPRWTQSARSLGNAGTTLILEMTFFE